MNRNAEQNVLQMPWPSVPRTESAKTWEYEAKRSLMMRTDVITDLGTGRVEEREEGVEGKLEACCWLYKCDKVLSSSGTRKIIRL